MHKYALHRPRAHASHTPEIFLSDLVPKMKKIQSLSLGGSAPPDPRISRPGSLQNNELCGPIQDGHSLFVLQSPIPPPRLEKYEMQMGIWTPEYHGI